MRHRVEAVGRWYANDWQKLDNKIKSSIVEGVSVFLSIFDLPEVARVFCPPCPPDRLEAQPPGWEPQGEDTKPNGKAKSEADAGPVNAADSTAVRRYLPPLDDLIEAGRVLALNMPAGANPALARAIGVMLKNAWLQSLLQRPAEMKRSPRVYHRPAVFICDEYQAFASVGEDDPSGDEKSFALTRAMPRHSDCRHAVYFLA